VDEQTGHPAAAMEEHAGHKTVADRRGGREAHSVLAPQDVMGHGGAHGAMSIEDMTRDMRNRFLVALALSVPITLWSSIGREILGFTSPAPFGLRDDVFALILSLPVIFYSAWIFFDGAYRALRAKTLDMMVLVAVAVGTGWLYSLGVTLTGGGEVFYEAATVLATFVLLGHWFEMRARGGANDAVRTLLELAPPMAVVIRDGAEVEVPTAEVAVGPAAGASGIKDSGGRCGRGGRVRSRRVDGDRREPAGDEDSRVGDHWCLDQHDWDSVWPPRPRSWSAPGSAPSAAFCSRTPLRWRPPPAATRL
jgi:cation transport ATPase